MFNFKSTNSGTALSFLKQSSIALALTTAAVTAQGETLSAELDFGSEYPVMLMANETVTANIDFGYSFDSVESSCIKAVHKSGEPSSIQFTQLMGFLPDTLDPITLTYFHPFTFGWELVDRNDPDSGWQVVPFEGDFTDCTFSVPAWDLADGKTSIDIKPGTANYEAWSFELVVTGTVAITDIDLELDEEEGFTVSEEGGRVNYDASIRNLDSNLTTKSFKQWSVLKLPNGEMYPIHKSNELDINYNESHDYTRTYLNIPSWFAAGDYELFWYAADLSTGKITTESMAFTKDAFIPN